MKDIHQTMASLGTLVLTIKHLGFALAPLVIDVLLDLYGRLHINQPYSAIFLAFIVGFALSTNVDVPSLSHSYRLGRIYASCRRWQS